MQLTLGNYLKEVFGLWEEAKHRAFYPFINRASKYRC